MSAAGETPDLGAVFDAHMKAGFADLDLDATMVAEPHPMDVPVLTGGTGATRRAGSV